MARATITTWLVDRALFQHQPAHIGARIIEQFGRTHGARQMIASLGNASPAVRPL